LGYGRQLAQVSAMSQTVLKQMPTGIVKLALRRPYTFIVMALLIMIFGIASALRTPTDIFPNINIPVVSVVFSYTGLPP
jgi:multidrug efflux pump subunit AcrB